jgi:D-3-phosphoglycerate dehydrogenase
MKIVIAEKVSPATLAVLHAESNWQILTHEDVARLYGGLPTALADADGLIVRSAVQVDETLLASAPRLRVIGRAGVGVDNIDADAATRHGIVVMNTPGANAIAVAELTLGLMLALAREIPRANSTMHAGRWEKKSLGGSELLAKTLGILGLGRIGLEVARRARAFGMEIIGHDPFVAASVARENEVRLVALDELFRASDYLTLHVGLTPQTHGIINAATLAIMKPGARIINCARGELIDDAALSEALHAARIGGAALDVFTKEPLKDSAYFGMDRVLLSPHVAGSTTEAQEAVGVQIAHQVREYLKLGVVQNAVNVPSLTHEQYRELAPFAEMAGKLGSFLAQFIHAADTESPAGFEGIELGYYGRLAEAKTELVRNSAIEGVLGGVLGHGDGVNRINAASVAAERGIRLHESARGGGIGAASALRITLHTRGRSLSATGTVLHHTSSGAASGARAAVSEAEDAGFTGEPSPRLLSLDGIDIEAPLKGTLIALRNQDVPGVIGRIGTVIGEHGINVANFALGRAYHTHPSSQGMALAVIQVESSVAGTDMTQVIKALRRIDAVAEVHLIQLGERSCAATQE